MAEKNNKRKPTETKKRVSIMKQQQQIITDDSLTTDRIEKLITRRISFSEKKSVKEFICDPNVGGVTLWGSSYEESAHHNSIENNNDQQCNATGNNNAKQQSSMLINNENKQQQQQQTSLNMTLRSSSTAVVKEQKTTTTTKKEIPSTTGNKQSNKKLTTKSKLLNESNENNHHHPHHQPKKTTTTTYNLRNNNNNNKSIIIDDNINCIDMDLSSSSTNESPTTINSYKPKQTRDQKQNISISIINPIDPITNSELDQKSHLKDISNSLSLEMCACDTKTNLLQSQFQITFNDLIDQMEFSSSSSSNSIIIDQQQQQQQQQQHQSSTLRNPIDIQQQQQQQSQVINDEKENNTPTSINNNSKLKIFQKLNTIDTNKSRCQSIDDMEKSIIQKDKCNKTIKMDVEEEETEAEEEREKCNKKTNQSINMSMDDSKTVTTEFNLTNFQPITMNYKILDSFRLHKNQMSNKTSSVNVTVNDDDVDDNDNSTMAIINNNIPNDDHESINNPLKIYLPINHQMDFSMSMIEIEQLNRMKSIKRKTINECLPIDETLMNETLTKQNNDTIKMDFESSAVEFKKPSSNLIKQNETIKMNETITNDLDLDHDQLMTQKSSIIIIKDNGSTVKKNHMNRNKTIIDSYDIDETLPNNNRFESKLKESFSMNESEIEIDPIKSNYVRKLNKKYRQTINYPCDIDETIALKSKSKLEWSSSHIICDDDDDDPDPDSNISKFKNKKIISNEQSNDSAIISSSNNNNNNNNITINDLENMEMNITDICTNTEELLLESNNILNNNRSTLIEQYHRYSLKFNNTITQTNTNHSHRTTIKNEYFDIDETTLKCNLRKSKNDDDGGNIELKSFSDVQEAIQIDESIKKMKQQSMQMISNDNDVDDDNVIDVDDDVIDVNEITNDAIKQSNLSVNDKISIESIMNISKNQLHQTNVKGKVIQNNNNNYDENKSDEKLDIITINDEPTINVNKSKHMQQHNESNQFHSSTIPSSSIENKSPSPSPSPPHHTNRISILLNNLNTKRRSLNNNNNDVNIEQIDMELSDNTNNNNNNNNNTTNEIIEDKVNKTTFTKTIMENKTPKTTTINTNDSNDQNIPSISNNVNETIGNNNLTKSLNSDMEISQKRFQRSIAGDQIQMMNSLLYLENNNSQNYNRKLPFDDDDLLSMEKPRISQRNIQAEEPELHDDDDDDDENSITFINNMKTKNVYISNAILNETYSSPIQTNKSLMGFKNIIDPFRTRSKINRTLNIGDNNNNNPDDDHVVEQSPSHEEEAEDEEEGEIPTSQPTQHDNLTDVSLPQNLMPELEIVQQQLTVNYEFNHPSTIHTTFESGFSGNGRGDGLVYNNVQGNSTEILSQINDDNPKLTDITNLNYNRFKTKVMDLSKRIMMNNDDEESAAAAASDDIRSTSSLIENTVFDLIQTSDIDDNCNDHHQTKPNDKNHQQMDITSILYLTKDIHDDDDCDDDVDMIKNNNNNNNNKLTNIKINYELLDKYLKAPTIFDVYNQQKRHSINIRNYSMDLLHLPLSFTDNSMRINENIETCTTTTAAIDLLYENFEKQLSDDCKIKQQSNSNEDELNNVGGGGGGDANLINSIFPLAPSMEYLIENKWKSEPSHWSYNSLYFPIGLIQFTHRAISSLIVNMKFKNANGWDTNEQRTKNNDKIIFEKITIIESKHLTHEKLSPIDWLAHQQLLLLVPIELTMLCPTSNELFPFLNGPLSVEYYSRAYQKVIQLDKICIENHATLKKLDRQCYIQKRIINLEPAIYLEINIKLDNIDCINGKNVYLKPCQEFSHKIRLLPNGLEFLQLFLSNPMDYINYYMESTK